MAADVDAADSDAPKLGNKEKTIIAAVGGVLVGLAAYPLPSYEGIFSGGEIDGFGMLGWFARIVGFGFLGGWWGYLQRSENDKLKIFQFGVVGPAVISAMLAAQVPKDLPDSSAVNGATARLEIVSTAHAQTTAKPAAGQTTKPTARPTKPATRQSGFGRFLRGLLGISSSSK